MAVTLFSAGISVGSAETFEYNLSPGWNLISLPLEPLDTSVTSSFPDAISAFGFSDGYFAVSELTPCKAYWVNLAEGGSYIVEGSENVSGCSETMASGWHLFGAPREQAPVEEILQDPADILTSVFGFENGYYQADTMDEGRGYWVNLSAEGTIVHGTIVNDITAFARSNASAWDSFTPTIVSDEDQVLIDENLALIRAYFAETEPDHFLILVGDKETLVDDMSCNAHDQAVVEQMFTGGNPQFLHLAPKDEIYEGALNGKYRNAPQHIKDAINFVNQFADDVFAVSDGEDNLAFNYVNEEAGILNGECQDLGLHQLGLFKDTDVVTHMNLAGYGLATWNGLPVYASYTCKAWPPYFERFKNTNNCGCKQCGWKGWSTFSGSSCDWLTLWAPAANPLGAGLPNAWDVWNFGSCWGGGAGWGW